MLGSLQSVIDQDAALSCKLESYKTWSDRTGHNASLNEIMDKLESAITKVSDFTFYALEMAEYDGAVLFEFISLFTKPFYVRMSSNCRVILDDIQ